MLTKLTIVTMVLSFGYFGLIHVYGDLLFSLLLLDYFACFGQLFSPGKWTKGLSPLVNAEI